MSTDDAGVRRDEETFADVLNGLTLSGRRARAAHSSPEPMPAPSDTGPAGLSDDLPEENAASVRAYAWTGGRTRSDIKLAIETLVSTSDRADRLIGNLCTEHQSVARLCRSSKSVAEIAALLSLPLGVIRVLLGDMANLGLIVVHHNNHRTGLDDRPDLELMERVLHGLTNLRATPAAPGSRG